MCLFYAIFTDLTIMSIIIALYLYALEDHHKNKYAIFTQLIYTHILYGSFIKEVVNLTGCMVGTVAVI